LTYVLTQILTDVLKLSITDVLKPDNPYTHRRPRKAGRRQRRADPEGSLPGLVALSLRELARLLFGFLLT
ncbi:MAG: hypothetical protein Q4E45_11795, partial [Eubacteriales bacterium]|nr:hypothetical protein [Eubacteriales bacterium]